MLHPTFGIAKVKDVTKDVLQLRKGVGTAGLMGMTLLSHT